MEREQFDQERVCESIVADIVRRTVEENEADKVVYCLDVEDDIAMDTYAMTARDDA